jgi:quercetin dioxygenase-like cupin family protein
VSTDAGDHDVYPSPFDVAVGWAVPHTAGSDPLSGVSGVVMAKDAEETSGRHTEPSGPLNLQRAAAELLRSARASSARRAGRTLVPGAGAPLKQSLLALVAGQSLSDHESPGAATLQVISGVVRLTVGGQDAVELHAGDHAAIPTVRHGLDAVDDAVVLLSVGATPEARSPAHPPPEGPR